MQFVFQMQQLVLFTLQHLAYRYARPAGNHIGDVLGIDFFFNHCLVTLHLVQFLLRFFNFLIQRLQFAVTYFGNLSVIAFTFRLVGLKLQVLYFDLVLLNLVDQCLFALPLRLVRLFLLFQFGKFLTDLLEFGLVVFTFNGFPLNLQLFDFT